VHRPAHDGLFAHDLVEEHVLVEGAEDYEEAPVAEARMPEATPWPKLRMLAQKAASGFNRSEVAIRDLPTGVDGLPLELLLNVRDEFVRLADTHDAGEPVRERTRLRSASKSLLVSGVVGLSADSSNQLSSSGVILKGVR